MWNTRKIIGRVEGPFEHSRILYSKHLDSPSHRLYVCVFLSASRTQPVAKTSRRGFSWFRGCILLVLHTDCNFTFADDPSVTPAASPVQCKEQNKNKHTNKRVDEHLCHNALPRPTLQVPPRWTRGGRWAISAVIIRVVETGLHSDPFL